MKYTAKIALDGMLSGLAVVLLYAGSLSTTVDLSAAAAGSVITMIALLETGTAGALGVYAVTSALSLILLPNKFAAVIFVAFSGFWPIAKVLFTKVKPKLLSYALRILAFNVFFTAIVLVSKYLIVTDDVLFKIIWLAYLAGNVVFLLYDFALERLALFYLYRIKPRFKR